MTWQHSLGAKGLERAALHERALPWQRGVQGAVEAFQHGSFFIKGDMWSGRGTQITTDSLEAREYWVMASDLPGQETIVQQMLFYVSWQESVRFQHQGQVPSWAYLTGCVIWYFFLKKPTNKNAALSYCAKPSQTALWLTALLLAESSGFVFILGLTKTAQKKWGKKANCSESEKALGLGIMKNILIFIPKSIYSVMFSFTLHLLLLQNMRRWLLV